jgi:hypothetical protein
VSESKSDRHHLLALFSALSAKQGIQIITWPFTLLIGSPSKGYSSITILSPRNLLPFLCSSTMRR